MSTKDTLDSLLRDVHDIRFKEFEDEVVRRHTLFERAKKFEQSRDKRRREFLKGIGVDLTAFDTPSSTSRPARRTTSSRCCCRCFKSDGV